MFKEETTKIRFMVALLVVGLLAGTLFITRGANVFSSQQKTVLRATGASPAPEIVPGTWINSEPLTLKALRGKVVVLEFWTFACYNCRNTLPFVKSWNERYASKGLVVIGVHSPEFGFEADPANVKHAVSGLNVAYPIPIDSNRSIW